MTWVIAHRGASAEERENTIPAFERAIALGADFVELDVQASADGALVVFHDLDLDRLTPLRGPLRRRTLAELREHGIPTLEEVVELTRGRIGVMAELKRPYLFRRHDVIGRTVALLGEEDVLLSFSRRALQEALRRRPLLRVLQHVGYGVSIGAAASYAWGVGFHDPRVTARGVARARRLGLETTVYTVNDARRMRALATMGVSGIFSDRPALLRKTLDSVV
jgi:glycerophosphoryl diester phosphodiesterase